MIKSDFFLQNMMNMIKIKKRLDIARYNKNIQKRLKIDLNTYKQYSEKYSSIEIELEFSSCFKNETMFINRELNSFYHIFFNGDKKKDFNYIKSCGKILITKIIMLMIFKDYLKNVNIFLQ